MTPEHKIWETCLETATHDLDSYPSATSAEDTEQQHDFHHMTSPTATGT